MRLLLVSLLLVAVALGGIAPWAMTAPPPAGDDSDASLRAQQLPGEPSEGRSIRSSVVILVLACLKATGPAEPLDEAAPAGGPRLVDLSHGLSGLSRSRTLQAQRVRWQI